MSENFFKWKSTILNEDQSCENELKEAKSSKTVRTIFNPRTFYRSPMPRKNGKILTTTRAKSNPDVGFRIRLPATGMNETGTWIKRSIMTWLQYLPVIMYHVRTRCTSTHYRWHLSKSIVHNLVVWL